MKRLQWSSRTVNDAEDNKLYLSKLYFILLIVNTDADHEATGFCFSPKTVRLKEKHNRDKLNEIKLDFFPHFHIMFQDSAGIQAWKVQLNTDKQTFESMSNQPNEKRNQLFKVMTSSTLFLKDLVEETRKFCY